MTISRRVALALALLLLAVPLSARDFFVPADAGWIDSGILLIPGMRLQVRAFGTVNVGLAGTFGPEGSSMAAGAGAGVLPSRKAPFALIIRLTASPNPDDPLHLDFTPRELADYCTPSAAVAPNGYLWLRVNDGRPEDNSGEFIATIDISSCGAPNIPEPRTTRVLVSKESLRVPSASVYVDGRRRAITNHLGEAVLPRLVPGSQLVARAEVAERRGLGSPEPIYRTFLTSAVVQDDGSVMMQTVNDPSRRQEMVLKRDNALVGFRITASIEYDASPSDIEAVIAQINATSEFLYNATDGQFLIAEVDLADNGRDFDLADLHVMADQTGRASAHIGGLFRLPGTVGMYVARYDWSYIYAHEFGHYGMDLNDEYSDADPGVYCTAAVGIPGAPYFNNDKSSCLMWHVRPKFCSSNQSNPHVPTTNQGPTDCFSDFIATFRDPSVLPRWVFRSPASRRSIPGQLPPLIPGWRPRINATNVRDGVLCPPFRFVPTLPGTDTPIAQLDVYLFTAEGRRLYLGRTAVDDPMTAANETADGLIVVGASPGDRVLMGTAYTVPPCTDVSASLNSDLPVQIASLALPPLAQTARTAAMETRYVPVSQPAAAVSVEPRGDGRATLIVRFRETVTGATASITKAGSTNAIAIPLARDGQSTRWRGELPDLGGNVIADIHYKANADAVQGIERVRISTAGPDDVRSHDGQLSLTTTNALPAQSRVAVTRDALARGPDVIAGPYIINASAPLRGPATLRFHVARSSGFDPNSFTIVRLVNDRWVPVKTVRRIDVGVFIAQIRELGTYALTARPKRRG